MLACTLDVSLQNESLEQLFSINGERSRLIITIIIIIITIENVAMET